MDHDYSRQIANVRTYFPPTEETRAHYEFLRARVADLMEQFTFHCPPSRELSLALTKLEEAQFFANAAIARHAGPPAQS